MLSLIRTFLFFLLIYYLVKWFRNFTAPTSKNRPKVKGKSSENSAPPPYDPRNVEDIDYREVKKKRNGSS